MKRDKINTLLVILLTLGISLLLYPSIADWWNASRSSALVDSYNEELAQMSVDERQMQLDSAREYNSRILTRPYATDMSQSESEDYYSQLDYNGNKVMATVEIPSVNISMPVYHGTNENLLQRAIGHIEWTSLPVGGDSTHSVITGHRGLVSARLFTDIDRMIEGDVFHIHVLGEQLTYLVDQITIVEPHQVEDLRIEQGQDYVTLLTCTPYGINSHRLLVRGHRIDYDNQVLNISSEAYRINWLVVAGVLALPMSLIFGIGVIKYDKKKRNK